MPQAIDFCFASEMAQVKLHLHTETIAYCTLNALIMHKLLTSIILCNLLHIIAIVVSIALAI